MTKNHEFWTDRLSEFLDEGLEPREMDAVRDHLQGCSKCRAVVEDLAEVRSRA